MKILVTGVKGQLGYDVVKEAESRNITSVGVDIEEMDITNAKQVSLKKEIMMLLYIVQHGLQ